MLNLHICHVCIELSLIIGPFVWNWNYLDREWKRASRQVPLNWLNESVCWDHQSMVTYQLKQTKNISIDWFHFFGGNPWQPLQIMMSRQKILLCFPNYWLVLCWLWAAWTGNIIVDILYIKIIWITYLVALSGYEDYLDNLYVIWYTVCFDKKNLNII